MVPAYLGRERKARSQAARTQIELLGTALDTFRLDVGRYPSSQEGLTALQEGRGIPGWDGPYLKKGVPADPWGRAVPLRELRVSTASTTSSATAPTELPAGTATPAIWRAGPAEGRVAHPRDARTQSERGFSLFELIVVLMIVAIASGLAAPGIQSGWRAREVRTGTRSLAGVMRGLRERAVRRGVEQELVIDADGQTFSWPDGKEATLPGGATITAIRGGWRDQDGRVRVVFYPNGGSSGVSLLVVASVTATACSFSAAGRSDARLGRHPGRDDVTDSGSVGGRASRRPRVHADRGRDRHGDRRGRRRDRPRGLQCGAPDRAWAPGSASRAAMRARTLLEQTMTVPEPVPMQDSGDFGDGYRWERKVREARELTRAATIRDLDVKSDLTLFEIEVSVLWPQTADREGVYTARARSASPQLHPT